MDNRSDKQHKRVAGPEPDNARNPLPPRSKRLDTQGAADYLGVSVPYLKRERQLGRGPAFIRLGRRVVYDSRDLDQHLEENRREPAAA